MGTSYSSYPMRLSEELHRWLEMMVSMSSKPSQALVGHLSNSLSQTTKMRLFASLIVLAFPGKRSRALVPAGHVLFQPVDHLPSTLGMLTGQGVLDSDALQ